MPRRRWMNEVHLLGEDAEAVAALEFGAVERDVGFAHQLAAVDAGLRRDGDADRDADKGRAAEQVEGLRDRLR